MSAMSHSTKFSFGGFFKNLFHRSSRNGHADQAPPTDSDSIEPAEVTESASVHAAVPAHNGNGNGNGASNGVAVPLQAILAALPLELRAKVRQQDVGALTVTVPFDKILSQLASGVV